VGAGQQKKNPQVSEGHTSEHEEMAWPVQTGYPICLSLHLCAGGVGCSETVQEKVTYH